MQRVCTVEVPIPYSAHLEQAALPQAEKIIAMAKKIMEKQ
jgi:pyruvate/2-oxoglutarate/acetoin dehydrogenase E1 component